MGQPFRKINASIAGGFGSYGDKIKQWVEVNGGKFSKQLNSNVTHLITTESAFKKSTPEGMCFRHIFFLFPSDLVHIYSVFLQDL